MDLELARRFVALHPPPGRVLLCAVTGSHLYGFSSPDSDLDLKGVHLAPTERLLGLAPPAPTHDRLEVHEAVECDLTTQEAGKALGLLLKGNGNLLEQVTSPLQLFDTPELHALRSLVPATLSRRCHGHYRGYLRGMQREHRTDRRAKSLLYSFRVALTGIHLLRTGEVQAHLPTLAQTYGFSEVLPLIARKQATAEKVALTEAEAAPAVARWPELEALLDSARDDSPLPEEPPDRAACEAWLVGLRVAALRSG